MKDRLLQIRNAFNLNQEEFGERIGLSKASISALEGGSRNLTDRHIMLLRSELDVNEDWLRTGDGEMFVQSETFSLDEKAQKNNLSELEIDIIQGYMELDRETRTKFMGWIKGTFDRHAETAATTEKTVKRITEPTKTIVKQPKDSIEESDIEKEVAAYRAELEAEQKGATLSASDVLHGKLG